MEFDRGGFEVIEWKKIDGYDHCYEVSNTGVVRNTDYRGTGNVRYLKPQIHYKGYLRVGLSIDGKQRHMRIHRLVAMAFLPNDQNKPQVNHIDENKRNNNSENLEWCTNKENVNHGSASKRMAESHRKAGTYQKLRELKSKPVKRTSLCGKVKVFPSLVSVEDDGFNKSSVASAMKRKNNVYRSYKWQYV